MQLERWILEAADRVTAGQPLEDALVELKASWPEPDKAARRLAGHANAARGETILWIIGLDEQQGAVGAGALDLADWCKKVANRFDELAPTFLDLIVPYKGVQLVGLAFDTGRAPFVVQNPVHGTPGGGPVSLEVPWREGTRIRSATRSDLIRLLSPLQLLPTAEVLKAQVQHSTRTDPEF